MKRIIPVILMSGFLLSGCVTQADVDAAYKAGYFDGYKSREPEMKEQYDSGYDAGYEKGYSRGIEAQSKKSSSDVQAWEDSVDTDSGSFTSPDAFFARKAANSQAFDTDSESAYERGYEDGYRDGVHDTKSDIVENGINPDYW